MKIFEAIKNYIHGGAQWLSLRLVDIPAIENTEYARTNILNDTKQ